MPKAELASAKRTKITKEAESFLIFRNFAVDSTSSGKMQVGKKARSLQVAENGSKAGESLMKWPRSRWQASVADMEPTGFDKG